MVTRPHILFVCGRNQWRSPTAEHAYRMDRRVEVRSAGVSRKSKHPISEKDIDWADLILVMETAYKWRILDMFRGRSLPEIHSIDIPDEYEFMDQELVDLIRDRVEYYIHRLQYRI